MANLDVANGFLPYINPSDSGGGQAKKTYLLLDDSNTIIGIGDPVTIASGRVNRAAAADALCGIAAEAKAASAGTSVKIAVWADPQQFFVAQQDAATTGTGDAITAIGLNSDFIAGNASNGRSIAELDESSAATTAALPFKLLRLSDEKQGNADNAFGQSARIVVKINNHQFGTGTGTVGT